MLFTHARNNQQRRGGGDADAGTAALNEALETLSDLFPNVDADELRHMLESFSEESRLFVITDMLLRQGKDGGIPRRRVGAGLEAWERFRTEGYRQAARGLLYKEFKGLSKSTIKAVMAEHNNSYTNSRATLTTIATRSWRFSFTAFFRGTRSTIPPEPPIVLTGNTELDAELFALTKRSREKQITADWGIAKLLNEAEHAAASELVECECCYGDYPWDEIAVCSAGHFFCHGCLLKSVQEGLYGQGRNLVGEMCSVRCLSSSATPPCEGFVGHELLATVLPLDVLQHLEDKTASDSLERSGLELVKCPFCCYAEVAEPVVCRLKRSAAIFGVVAAVIVAAFVPLVLSALVATIVMVLSTSVAQFFPHAIVGLVGELMVAASIQRLVNKTAMKIASKRRGALFKCASARCGRESCIECGKEWQPFHKCFEKEEDSVRIFVEKAMADAVKRTVRSPFPQVVGDENERWRLEFENEILSIWAEQCPLCHVSFVKSDGCNKLTCPCGYVMCYVCRADIRAEGYKHFCQHFRQVPGTTCDECESCDLYVQEDEAAAIKKAAEKAEQEYFRRFKKPEGWIYRRMKGSVLGSNVMVGVAEVENGGSGWFDMADAWLGLLLEGALEVCLEGRWVSSGTSFWGFGSS